MLRKSSRAGGRCNRGIVSVGGPSCAEGAAAGGEVCGAAGCGCVWTVFCGVFCAPLLCAAKTRHAAIAADAIAAPVRALRRVVSRKRRSRPPMQATPSPSPTRRNRARYTKSEETKQKNNVCEDCRTRYRPEPPDWHGESAGGAY